MSDFFNTYIQPEDLLANLDNPNWMIVDCSNYLLDPELGYADYLNNHIPNSVYAHLNKDLSGKITPTTGRHPLPETKDFEYVLSNWGFDPQMQVVAYDSAGGTMAAARLWWLLNYFGFSNIALLSGGIQNWLGLDYPLTQSIPIKSKSSISVKPNLNMIVHSQELRESIYSETHVLLDGRAYNRYLGMDETIDPIPGHIPGANSAPVLEFLDADNHPKPVSEIKTIVSNKLGGKKPEEIIYYCGSGVTASFGIFSMVHAGFPMPKLYPGSWSEWIKQPWAEIAAQPKQ
jgi:thiosulfate/3-mercaptopyruvate sulfurtransferase